MDLSALLPPTQEGKSPLQLVHFTKPWSQVPGYTKRTVGEEDGEAFFDAFANTLILYKSGRFTLIDMQDKTIQQGTQPFQIHLAVQYDKILAAAVHPSKKCLALTTHDNVLTLLFMSDQAAEEVKLTFSKAKIIHAFSFATGSEDFNFFVVTNLSIDLYKVDTNNQRARIVKNIPLELPNNLDPVILVEPVSCSLVAVDTKTGQCYPYFMHMHREGNSAVKGVQFKLDINPTGATSAQGASGNTTMNESMTRSSIVSARASISEKARALFSSKSDQQQQLHLVPQVMNKNIKHIQSKLVASNVPDLFANPDAVSRRQQSQLLLTWVHNKLLVFHLLPGVSGSTIQLYEVDPNFSQRAPGYLSLKTFNGSSQLMQMQVIDSLLVVHNLDEATSQVWDVRLGGTDWNVGLLKEGVSIDPAKATSGKYLMEMIEKDEQKANDHAYKFFNQQLPVQFHQQQHQVEEEKKEDDDETQIDTSSTTALAIPSDYKIYDDMNLVFVEPMYILDLRTRAVLTLRLSLKNLLAQASDQRVFLSLINRARNKPTLLKSVRERLVHNNLSLLIVNRLFYKLNAVYKQATIERQAVKRKDIKERPMPFMFDQIALMKDHETEVLVQQMARIGRLKASTTLSGSPLNGMLMEYTPSNRVLSGEVIIFQNDMVEIFKEMIQAEIKKPKYVTSVIMEFFHSLIEHSIPQQAALQNMLVKFVLDNKDYPTFQMLLQYHVLNENIELARLLINLGSVQNLAAAQEQPEGPAEVPKYYEPAYQAGLDMMKKLKTYDEIVVALLNEGLTLRALNFAQAYNIHSMKQSSFLEVVDTLRQEGKNREADILFMRIAEVKKYDEAKLITDPQHMAILVEE